jgi:hypothetical protein
MLGAGARTSGPAFRAVRTRSGGCDGAFEPGGGDAGCSTRRERTGERENGDQDSGGSAHRSCPSGAASAALIISLMIPGTSSPNTSLNP